VAAIARRGRQRVKASLAAAVAAGASEREDELLRQMSDMFKELAHLSVDLGAVWRSVECLRTQIEAQASALAELVAQIDDENQSAEILGRLMQSTRARLDVLEGAVPGSA
jgi:septal ring factor EnvC (AmiA/AmiB activator)